MSNDQTTEQMIQEKGLSAPRLTPDLIDGTITGEEYRVFPGSYLTICVLTLQNGFTVSGESACASPENFDGEIGRKVARENARAKIWALEGYLLKERLMLRNAARSTGDTKLIAAMMAHELNRLWCATLGDFSQPSWATAPEWQKASALNGVQFHWDNPEAGDSASHDSWMKEKLADGWKHGPVKDPAKKEHPCIVPFEQLPPEQQMKDTLFRAIVHAFAPVSVAR